MYWKKLVSDDEHFLLKKTYISNIFLLVTSVFWYKQKNFPSLFINLHIGVLTWLSPSEQNAYYITKGSYDLL